MDKLKKHILFILLISILLCSVQAIAAADISDANGNDVFDLSNDIETVEAGTVDDVIMASEDAVNDNSEILSASNSDEVLSAEPDGNFTQLRNRINGASDTLELDRDYVYDFRYDYYYVRTSGISINKNIVIDGKGHTIDAKGFSRIFQLTGNHVITLKNIVFINGFASDNYGGAIYSARNRNVTLTIDNCTFRNNTAGPNRGTRGGAIYLRAPRELIINNSRFENNSAYYGGAIYGERYIIDNCNFTDNKASFSGSAIYSYTESGNTGTKSISNTRILDNQALATSLSFDYLNPSRDPGTGKIIFDGFIGNFEGGDNLINGIYSNGTYPSFNDVTYLGEDGETTTSSVPTCTNREAGIPIHIIITQNGDIVKDILVTTNSTGGYMVTEEELQLDYGTYSAYAVHYEDTYYTYIKSSSISNFNSYMHITTITNQSVTGYAGDKVNVTFNVTYNTTDWLGRVTVHNVTNGTVIVSIGNQNYTATVRNGQAKVEVVLPEESGDYTALYDGTGTSYWNSTGTLKITILEKEDSTVTVDPEDIHVGDDETIKFNVTDGATGTVKITITGDALDSPIVISDVPISSGAEGVIVPDLAAGTYTVKVEYGGDNHYNPSNGTATFTVSKYDSSVTVDAIDIVYGDNETIKYNVTEDATGTVNITVTDENGEVIASFKNVPIANGTAGVNVAGLSCGTYTVNVTYGGDDQYESSYGTDDFTVGQATPSVTVDASDITYPETENLDIKVTGVSGGAVPSGNVTVTIVDSEGNVVETIADRPISNGVVTVQVTGLAAGEYNVTVVYNGDVNYTEATGKATFKVKKAVPEVIVDASDISYPGDETIDIIVSGVSGGAVPSGNVTVSVTDGSGAVVKTFTEEALADGELSVTVSGLAAGKYNVTVTYNGDENYTSAEDDDVFTVGQATPSVTVDAGDVTYPADASVDITVSGAGAVPSGNVTVTVTDGSGAVVKTFTEEALVDGELSVTVSGLAAGDYSVAVTYNGDVNYTKATGEGAFTVGQATPSVTVDVSDVTYPETDSISINVTGVSGGAVPSGNVTVSVTDGSGAVVKTFTEEALVDGKVTVTVSGLAAGDYSVAVNYNGDVNYTEATGEGAFTVKKASPTMDIDTTDITVQSTENIVITVSGAGAVPSGNVTVIITDEDGNVIETVDGAVLSDGTVTVPIEGLAAGKYNVSVTYNGDVNYTSASDNANFEVLKHNVTIEVVTAVIGYTGETIQVVIKLTDETGADVINGTVDYIIDFDNRISSLLGASNVIVLTAPQDVSNGTANVPVELSAAAGVYPATVSYKGNELYNDAQTSDEAIIKALDTSIESDDISGTIGDKVTVTADIKDKDDNPVKNGTAVLIIDGKKYTAEVKDGKATFDNVELPSKNTTAIIEYLGNDYYNASSITVDVTVNEENQNKTENNTENNTEDNTGDNTQEVASKSVELLATGNPIAMLVLVLLTLVSTISIRRQK